MSDARQHEPVAAHRQERRERRLVARGHRWSRGPAIGFGAQDEVVELRGQEDLPLVGAGGLQQLALMSARASATGWPAGRSISAESFGSSR